MAVAGALHVDFTTNSAAFVRDMGKASRAVNSNSAKMNKSLARLDRGFLKARKSLAAMAKRTLSLRSAVGLLVGSAGLGLLIKRSLDTADSISKVADATGISTKAIQKYRHALNQSGVATEATDKGLKKFTRNMGELARASSETQTSLRDLDPALLENLRSLESVEDQLAAGFRALASYTSESKRAAVGAALFGRAGGDMAVGVKKGIVAFEALQQRAVDLGLVLRRELLDSAVDTKDRLAELTAQIGTSADRILLNLAPAILGVTGLFADFTQAIFDAGGALAGIFTPSDEQQLLTLEARLKALKAAAAPAPAGQLFPSSARAPKGPRGGIAGAVSGPGTPQRRPGTGGGGSEIAILERQIDLLRQRIETEKTAQNTASEAAAAAKAVAEERAVFLANELQTAEFIVGKLKEQSAARKVIADADRAAAESAASRALVVVRAGETAVEVYNREIQALKDLRDALAETGQSALLSQEQFQTAAKQSLERLKERQKAEAAARQTTDQLTLAQQRLVTSGFNLIDEALRGNMKTWQDWARVALRALENVLSGMLRTGSGFGGGGGGGLGDILGGGIGNFLGSILFPGGGIGGLGGFFEHGGRPPVGVPSLVGEKGPEVFVPDRAGTIIPNSGLGVGDGAANYTFAPTYIIDARNAKFGVEQDIIRALNQLDRSVEPRAVAAVVNARARQPRLFGRV